MGGSFTRFYTNSYPELINDTKLFNADILDLGAGDGEILYGILSRNLLDHSRVTAVEIDQGRCERINSELKKVNVYCQDATDLKNFPNNSFHTIICNQVIEHVNDDGKLIKEAYRVLKPGGKMYLSTMFKKKFNFGYHFNAKGQRTLDPTHVREYSDISLKLRLSTLFNILKDQKTLQWFSITDFILPRLGLQGHIYEENKLLAWLRKIKLPIVGYYNWEFLLWKK